jgi:hypothetical protein
MLDAIRARLKQYRCIYSLDKFDLEITPIMAFDIETAGADGLPGDSPFYDRHGIAGIALGNLHGDACYLVINDSRDYGGITVMDFVRYWNEKIKPQVKEVVLHYSKFDLSFLVERGVCFDGIRLVDTWILLNIKSEGIYGANKLKDYARTVLKIDTGTEELKDKFLEEKKTRDYGDVPVELMAPYACDDVRYTLMARFSLTNLTESDWYYHSLYMRNSMSLIAGERRGIRVNARLIQGELSNVREESEKLKNEIKVLLGSASAGLDIDDEQQMLAHLHVKGLHSGPRDLYGKSQFVFDEVYLTANNVELTTKYLWYWYGRTFEQEFSGNKGRIAPRIWGKSLDDAGFHLQHLQSIFSTGGIIKCKQPDFTKLPLLNKYRQFFAPREGHSFVLIRAVDLPTLLLAHYSRDTQLTAAVQATQMQPLAVAMVAERVNLKLPPRQRLSNDAVSILMRRVVEGSGVALLGLRMRARNLQMNKKDLYGLSDLTDAALADYNGFKSRVTESLNQAGFVQDKGGRILRIPDDKRYRAPAALIQSSYGSILSFYFDAFCRLSAMTNAHLVLAHEKEFLFEVPDSDATFAVAAKELSQRPTFDLSPVWKIETAKEWRNALLDSHELGVTVP